MGLNNTHSSWEKLFLSSTTEADGFNSFSSFNMTRGGGGAEIMEILKLEAFLILAAPLNGSSIF